MIIHMPSNNHCICTFNQQTNRKEEIVFDACDQYTIQGDLFSLAILNDTPVPTPLQDAVDNMIIIERLLNIDQQ